MTDARFPKEALRKKLVVAGIPEDAHTLAGLAAHMPDLDAKHLSVDTAAELVLYLISKGVITLPVAADKALLDLPWGSHVCQFYDTKQDQLDMLVPYFKQGLDRNEACAWLVGDLTIEEARTALAAVVPNLDVYLAKGQMQIRHYTEFYTDPNGTVKAPEQLSHQFASMGADANSKGYSGLRASGSVAWVQDDDSMSRFMAYETIVNVAIQNARIMAVCTYPTEAAALCGCRELIHNHGHFYVKRGEWMHDKSKDAERIESVFASLARA
ncbi:Sensory transduction histidine kinase [Lysobacter dokdonensis DS-58]|uniref:Sensory transduction histidine kinase n=1 Tax=Lysobacter dokdonensis DS-58 TaxID=1300345 RepID=A0A0A2WNF6_9GAMM|nr:MEDS domain-containing protein [Lysobacter dokdonensis]KGQ19825.1 Sensory transduction histidine kinase [Lysobacter dokdonensis DS-58]